MMIGLNYDRAPVGLKPTYVTASGRGILREITSGVVHLKRSGRLDDEGTRRRVERTARFEKTSWHHRYPSRGEFFEVPLQMAIATVKVIIRPLPIMSTLGGCRQPHRKAGWVGSRLVRD
jgi:hypothetical protein